MWVLDFSIINNSKMYIFMNAPRNLYLSIAVG